MTNPYSKLTDKVQEDSSLVRFEKQKLLLLALLLGSAWIMFFLLCDRLDGVFWTKPEPPPEYQPPARYQIHEGDEPIYDI